MNKYKILETIGTGTYGTVYKASKIDTRETVAIKKLNQKIYNWSQVLELTEVKALAKLKDHTNIIKLKEVIREANNEVFLVFEYAEKNLYQYITEQKNQNTPIPETKIASFAFQILNALTYIHKQGFIHRDLKPENILLINDSTIKIADFGLAREAKTQSNFNLNSFINGLSTNSDQRPMTSYICTRWYRAPENILRSEEYNQAIDVWAVGAIVAEMANQTALFPGENDTDQLSKIINVLGMNNLKDYPEAYIFAINNHLNLGLINLLPNYLANSSKDLIDFLSQILIMNPAKRPNANYLLNDKFFDFFRIKNNNLNVPRFNPIPTRYSDSSNSLNDYCYCSSPETESIHEHKQEFQNRLRNNLIVNKNLNYLNGLTRNQNISNNFVPFVNLQQPSKFKPINTINYPQNNFLLFNDDKVIRHSNIRRIE